MVDKRYIYAPRVALVSRPRLTGVVGFLRFFKYFLVGSFLEKVARFYLYLLRYLAIHHRLSICHHSSTAKVDRNSVQGAVGARMDS